MAKGAPIKLTLYGADDEVKGEFSRSIIPWKFLKRALKLAGMLESGDLTDADLDALGQLVVDFYGEQFSLADLENGADVSEMLVVLQAIVARAAELSPSSPNPTPQGQT